MGDHSNVERFVEKLHFPVVERVLNTSPKPNTLEEWFQRASEAEAEERQLQFLRTLHRNPLQRNNLYRPRWNTLQPRNRNNDVVPMEIDARAEADDDDGEDIAEGMSRSKPVIIVDSGFSTTVQSPEPESLPSLPTVAAVGSALKRNADGTVAAPKILKRKPKQAQVSPHTE